jgi:dUTP pyrophosphatase
MDLFAAWTVEILPGDRELIPIGLTVNLPTGHFGRITDCSSVALKRGLHVLTGTIDGDYTGQLFVLLHNTTKNLVSINEGEKVGQLIVQPYYSCTPFIVENNYVTDSPICSRNRRGFGHESTDELIPKILGVDTAENVVTTANLITTNIVAINEPAGMQDSATKRTPKGVTVTGPDTDEVSSDWITSTEKFCALTEQVTREAVQTAQSVVPFKDIRSITTQTINFSVSSDETNKET